MSNQAVTDLTIDDVIGELAASEHTVPHEPMQWALDHWDEAAPRFLELLSRFAAGTDRTAEAEIALFFITRLLAEKAETRAFRDLCSLMLEHDAAPFLAGDAITSTLSQFLISTFDGDADLLRSVVEGADVDEFVRHAAITAIGYLTRIGRIPEPDTRDWLQRLVTDMQPQGENYVWMGWTECVADLGLADFAPAAQRLCEQGCIDSSLRNFADFTMELQRTLDNPDPMAPFALRKLMPFASAIAELEEFYNSPEPGGDEYGWDDDEKTGFPPDEKTGFPPLAWTSGSSDRNPWRHVGRNDPCPCGSGKKFKKCCLGKPEDQRPTLGAVRRV